MELLRALAALSDAPAPGTASVAASLDLPVPTAADHTGMLLFQLYPYASVHLGAEGMLGGEARDRVAGFLRTLGATPPAEPDHLAVLLTAAAHLAEREADAGTSDEAAAWRRARAALLWEHLLSWTLAFTDRVVAHGGPYAPWAELLQDALRHEAEVVGPAASPPLHLREAPELDDPREAGAQGFLDQLLAPVRTGVILTRSDLARAAEDLGLGLRIGERRYVLAALLSQSPDAILDWLADEADRRAVTHAAHDWTGSIATFWSGRATNTASLLRGLSREAGAALAEVAAPA
jgi:hypothetical protein